MSNVPEARQRLVEVFTKIGFILDEIEAIQKMLYRESPTRRAAPKARLTLRDARAIRRYARRHPKASMQAIATALGIPNSGRVSEVLSGKRFPEK